MGKNCLACLDYLLYILLTYTFKLGDSLPHLNAVVTSRSLKCVLSFCLCLSLTGLEGLLGESIAAGGWLCCVAVCSMQVCLNNE